MQFLDDALQIRHPAIELSGLAGLGVGLFTGKVQLPLGGVRIGGRTADTFGALTAGHQRQAYIIFGGGLALGRCLLRLRIRLCRRLATGGGGFRFGRCRGGILGDLGRGTREALAVFLPDFVLAIDLRQHHLSIGAAELREIRNVKHGTSA